MVAYGMMPSMNRWFNRRRCNVWTPGNVTNQKYTNNGGGGMIVGVAVPEGYTVSSIPSGDASTATVTGSGETSFTIVATLFFPQGAAGDDTVSCSGTLTLSDGTQVDSSPNGSAQVAAVDSVICKDSPGSLSLGQTLTQSDFTITTTPAGYGNNSELVNFTPSSFAIAVGDNWVNATCGVSSAKYDVIGVEEHSAWGSITYNDYTGQETGNFTVEINGIAGQYSMTGPDILGGNTSGSLTDDTPFSGMVQMNVQGDNDDYANVATPNGGTSGGAMVKANKLVAGKMKSNSAAGLFWEATGVVLSATGYAVEGSVTLAAKAAFMRENPRIQPGSETQLLSLHTANPGNYRGIGGAQVTSTATWTAGGFCRWGVVDGYLYTYNPSFQINCGVPSALNAVVIATNTPFNFDTTSFIDIPTIPLGQYDTSKGIAFCNGNPKGITDTANQATQASASYSGYCGIQSDDGEASLFTAPNDAGWVAGPAPLPSSQSITVDWFY